MEHRIVIPREPMAQKIIKWCNKNCAGDISCFDGNNRDRYWSDDSGTITATENEKCFDKCIDGGRELVEYWIAKLNANSNNLVAIIAEGGLNHVLHGGTNYRIARRFERFLARYGYKCACLANCYYLVYQKKN